MRKAGYFVTDVYNGESMLKAFEKRRYDAAIMDIQIPDINGIELLKSVREIDLVIGTLMLSGVATLEDAVESLN
jgi:DNA-binding response OmpR family regulator